MVPGGDNGAMPSLFHIAFYRFVLLPDAERVSDWLRQLTAGLTGSVLVAEEGVNGVLAGPPEALDAFEAQFTADPRFAGMVFRRSACSTPPFARMKVHHKPEIVAVGIDGARASGTGAVSPAEWRALLAREDVVVLDNRNHFEFRLGRFQGAVDPGVRHFRDFPTFVAAHAPAWRAAGRTVAMYCTGGIRCEKTSGWMASLGLDVRQLDGGILNYFASLPDAERDWQGECFVFDNRIALDTRLAETATTAERVYGDDPAEAWRLERARRLDAAG